MPSIWWENSPVVIQEALRNHRPIVCSDIGGMAEKVRDGVDGFHFPVGNAPALVSLLLSLASEPTTLALLRTSMRLPSSVDEIVLRHRQLYAGLFN
jgi:glycosyltransferase involved in cell wall biosynthesis